MLTVLSALPADVRGAAGSSRSGFVETFRLAARSRLMACAVLMMSLVAVISGLLETLVPLHMGADGYSARRSAWCWALAGVGSAATQLRWAAPSTGSAASVSPSRSIAGHVGGDGAAGGARLGRR